MLESIEIVNLTILNIEKRRKCYLKAGIYSISCQVFMTDLLRGSYCFGDRLESTIVISLREKVKNYYDYHAWMATFLKIKEQELES